MTTETAQQRAERIVRQEVNCCLSALVSTLAKNAFAFERTDGANRTDVQELSDLAEQAAELASPVDDYEEAAVQAGFVFDKDNERWSDPEHVAKFQYMTARDACDNNNIEPYQREVFEFWAISDWLGRKLEAKGEKVDFDFAGLVVWARCTSGQAIAIDSVIEDIAKDLATA